MHQSLRTKRISAMLLLLLAVSILTACSQARPGVSAPGASSVRHGAIYRFFNPSYAKNWSWWKKALFWAGPGH